MAESEDTAVAAGRGRGGANAPHGIPSDGTDILTEADTEQPGWWISPPPQDNDTVERTGPGGAGRNGRTCALCGHAAHEGRHCHERLPKYRALTMEFSLRHRPWIRLIRVNRTCGCCLRCRGKGGKGRGSSPAGGSRR